MVRSLFWAAVQKKVLQSQPPRQVDIPDMTDYVRVWGGMPSGSFVRDLGPLMSHFVPPDRIISGDIFKRLSLLKFLATEELPAHVVNCVLFLHAASKTHVCDNFARFVTKGDITNLGGEKLRPHVMRANGVLKGRRR